MAVKDICERIDLALEKMKLDGVEVRAICLNEKDLDDLCRRKTREYRQRTGSKAILHPCSYKGHLIYQDHEVRSAKASNVWSKQGVGYAVPVRLPKVKAEADG
jgi:hypothetical protein